MLFITLIAFAFTRLQKYPAFHYSLSLTPFLLVGLPLGIILGFVVVLGALHTRRAGNAQLSSP